MPLSFRFNVLYFVCILVADLKVVVGFLPVPAASARDLNLQEHPLQVRLPAMYPWSTFYQIPGTYATTRADHDHDTAAVSTGFC